MALRDILDRQAGTIEYILHTHGIRAQIDGGKLSPRLTQFHLALPPGLNPARLAPFVPEISGALGVVSCRLAHVDGAVYLEVPRPDPVPVRLLPIVQRVADVVPPATATLGLDTEGTPLLLRLNSPDVDPVIISGLRGSGKSSLLRSIALSLALHNSPNNLRLLLLDCSGEAATFRGLENLPQLSCPIAMGHERQRGADALVSLRWALRTLARRAHMPSEDELLFDDGDGYMESEPLFEYNPQRAEDPSLVIMIDGVGDLCATGNKRHDAEAVEALRRLLADGSRHGIHCVLSSERPDEIVGLNTGWGARITGKATSPEEARIATGAKGSGAQSLLGSGDFLIALNAELIRFQAASVSQAELARAVNLIRSVAQAQAERPAPEPREFRREPGPAATAEPRPIRRG